MSLVKESVSEVRSTNKTEVKTILNTISSLMNEIYNVAFDVNTLSGIKEIANDLKTVYNKAMRLCDYDSGIRLSGVLPKKSLRIKRKSTYVCDELPRKYAKPNPYAAQLSSSRHFHVFLTFLCKLRSVNVENTTRAWSAGTPFL